MPNLFKKRFKAVGIGAASGLFTLVRHALTILLLWLRTPLLWILSLVSTLSFVAWIFALLVNDSTDKLHGAMTWGLFIISVGAFGLIYLYDSLLNLVSPDGLIVEV